MPIHFQEIRSGLDGCASIKEFFGESIAHRPLYSQHKKDFWGRFSFGSALMNTDMVALIDPELGHPSSVAQLSSSKPN